jgi:hypothetical protein
MLVNIFILTWFVVSELCTIFFVGKVMTQIYQIKLTQPLTSFHSFRDFFRVPFLKKGLLALSTLALEANGDVFCYFIFI